MANTDSEYPSWKKALFGEDTVANLLCFVKWVLWQVMYGLLAVIGLFFIAGAWLLDKLFNTKAASGVSTVVQSKTTKTVSTYLWYGLLAFLVVYCIVGLGLIFYHDPIVLVFVLALIGAIVVAVAALVVIDSFYGDEIRAFLSWIGMYANRGHEKAAQTPGVRRVIGRCPVSFTLEPKWFDNLFDRFTP